MFKTCATLFADNYLHIRLSHRVIVCPLVYFSILHGHGDREKPSGYPRFSVQMGLNKYLKPAVMASLSKTITGIWRVRRELAQFCFKS